MISEFYIYQKEAMTFRKESADEWYALLNLSAEVGELHSLYAKSLRDGHKLPRDLVKKELGDILWMVAAIAQDQHMSLDEVAWGNLAKLRDRKERGVIEGNGDNR